MTAYKCKMCGGDLNFLEGENVCVCEFCGTRQTVPNADNEKKMSLFNRANRLRMNSEFDKAQTVYEQIVADFPEEAEAYWGLCLCKFGIEYVEDADGSRKPTCHRTVPTSIFDDPDFENVMEYADSVSTSVYRAEAKEIERVQRRILEIVQGEEPYDVFICYKETDDVGGRTEDSVLAQDIYDALTSKGLKVFFARITLESKLGSEYEPYIYAALSSAKVMLAIGTDFDYFSAVWVKNEWSRYLAMMKNDRQKTLIPCYKGMDAYDLPREFKNLQAQDMGKLGWMQDLVRGVEKLCGKGEVTATVQPTVQQTVVREVVHGSNAANLMKRVYLFLEDGNFDQAAEYIDKVLDIDAEYAPAYVGKILVQYKLKKEQTLSTLRKSIDSNADWQKALRFADAQQKQVYTSYAKAINGNEAYDKEYAEANIREEKYMTAVSDMNGQEIYSAVVAFAELGDYKDSKVYLQKCMNAYRQQLAVQKTAREEKEKHEQAIREEILRLNMELSQLHGLFNGGKRRELEGRIDALRREQTETEKKKQEYEQAVFKVHADASTAESALAKARAAQARMEAELLKKEMTRWTDKTIIAAAEAAMADAEAEAAAAEENAAVAAATVRRAELTSAGKTFTFGHYEQNNNTDNGKEAIEWQVLEVKDDRILIISKNTLDVKAYNSSYTSITWEKSTLRAWLNRDFLNAAFNPAEQAGIETTTVDNSETQGHYASNGGNDTQDKVFLLSYAEVDEYFSSDAERVSVLTRYAKVHEGSRYSGRWWLRSPGILQGCAIFVDSAGTCGGSTDASLALGVRPAMWVNLESRIFKTYIETGSWK